MCFSATASFVSASVLSVAGAISLSSAKKKNQKLFAAIPLIFGIQQLLEGLLWLVLPNASNKEAIAVFTFLFLFFAQVVWPLWVPLSVWVYEEDQKRKNTLFIFLIIGIIISGYLAFCLINYHSTAVMQDHHLQYQLSFIEEVVPISGWLYFISTVIPPFISTCHRLRILGTIIFLSFMVSKIYFNDYLISVWCFFAAILSILVILVVKNVPLGRFVNTKTNTN
jgi:hypothetical protein